jgi:acetyl esterase/lipase
MPAPSCPTLLTVLLGLACLPVAAGADATQPDEKKAAPFRVKTLKDLTYYDGPGHDKVKHKLDLYLPEGHRDFPVLLFVHGGGWIHGDKDFLGFYCMLAFAFAKRGIGVAVTNYRLSPGVQHPEHVKDIARAFAWLVANAGKHGGRKDALFLCGHSAGAHLVALLTADGSYLKAVGLSARAIRGVIPVSGPFVLPAGSRPHVFGSAPDAQKNASPITHARGDLPPFLILYADKDLRGCDGKQASAFCKALTDKGTRAETLEVKNSDHFRIILSVANVASPVSAAIEKFIRTHASR